MSPYRPNVAISQDENHEKAFEAGGIVHNFAASKRQKNLFLDRRTEGTKEIKIKIKFMFLCQKKEKYNN